MFFPLPYLKIFLRLALSLAITFLATVSRGLRCQVMLGPIGLSYHLRLLFMMAHGVSRPLLKLGGGFEIQDKTAGKKKCG